MNKILLLMVLGLLLSNQHRAQAYSPADLKKLQNDKEVSITSFKKREKEEILAKYTDKTFNQKVSSIISSSVLDFLNEEYPKCELALIKRIEKNLMVQNVPSDSNSIEDYFKLLRINHSIDDIFYEILSGTNQDYFNLRELRLDRSPSINILTSRKALELNNLEKLFKNFKTWPDEKESCVYQEFVNLKKNIKVNTDNKLNRDRYLEDLIHKAYKDKIIDLATYNKLEFLRNKSTMNKRDVWLKDYIKIVFNAKNKMIPINQTYVVKEIERENNFSTEKIKRFSTLTRRKILYRKYDETQIIMLAQVLQKASRRMGVDPDTETKAPYIGQEFSILKSDGLRETYVEKIELDPQSQYNYARRMLRKDVVELQMMDTFNKVDVTHADIVMAALETGYISLEDIEFVIKYDDLWNPEKTKFEKVMGFVFTVAGYGTFFLPPPWNLYTSLALTIVEGVIDNRTKDGATNDNPATIIE